MSENKREYTGLWIDKHILADKRFNGREMLVYAYMMSFGARFMASDRHIAMRLGMTLKTVRNTMSMLRKKGFIEGQFHSRKPIPYNNVPKSGQ